MVYFYLSIAVIAEIVATAFLKETQAFTAPLPSLLVGIMAIVAFYFLSLTLKILPIGIVYAVWSGASIILVILVDFLFYGQKIDLPAAGGIFLILVGVLVINLCSKTSV